MDDNTTQQLLQGVYIQDLSPGSVDASPPERSGGKARV